MIIDEDDDFLILNKPAGWSIYPQGSRPRPAVTSWLKTYTSLTPSLRPVHRLDVETSGLLICVKHQEGIRDLNALFRERQIHKTYWALCMRDPVTPRLPLNTTYSIQTPLGFDPQSQVRIKMGLGKQDALTCFLVRQYSPCSTLMWVEVIPYTGRQHQIRVHLSLESMPIVGDKLYGIDESFFIKAYQNELSPLDFKTLLFPRHVLHACQIQFEWRSKKYKWMSTWPSEVLNRFTWLSF
jgi:23S rRNA pseudouridine1911/1915/1917 synthase